MKLQTCVSIAENTPRRVKDSVEKSLKKSDYVEIRFDFLKPKDVPQTLELIKNHLGRCVCTLRPKKEGGVFQGNETERISIIKLIAEYNPFLLDIEFNTLKNNYSLQRYIKTTKTEILVSWHDFKKTPNKKILETKLKLMKSKSKWVKIVTIAKSVQDSSRLLSLYSNNHKIKLVAFSMGEAGRISRILCLFLGSPFTYVSLGKPVAPGQFSLDEVKSLETMKK